LGEFLRLELRWDAPIAAGLATLRLTFAAPLNRQLEGLYRVESGGDAYAFTQFEALSARRAFPCFDEPRFKTPFDLTVVTARDDQAITNTAEVSAADRDGGRRAHRFAVTEALPTYLLAFAVGPLEVVEAAPIAPNAVRATPLPLRGVAARGRGRYLQRALDDTAPLVALMERYFDRAFPYPKLDLIAVPDFAAGAMENAGAITFREPRLLVRPDAPADRVDLHVRFDARQAPYVRGRRWHPRQREVELYDGGFELHFGPVELREAVAWCSQWIDGVTVLGDGSLREAYERSLDARLRVQRATPAKPR
jgi:aminopeptidase N